MTSVVHDRTEPERARRSASARLDRGRAAHRHHRRRAAQRQPGRGLARRRPVRRDPGAAAAAQGAVPARPGHHPRRARRARASASARWRTTRSPAATPTIPGLVRIYKDLDSPPEHYENACHCDATWREAPPMGSRAALRRVPAGRRRHHLGQHGRRPTDGCREHVKDADRRPARPAQHRGQLRRGDADREAARAARAVPRRRAPGGAHPPGDRREDPVRQRLHHALRQLPHAGERALRPGLRARARATCCNYLISQAADPRVPGALALDAEQRRHLGQPLHPALRGPGLLARRPQDGARRHRRRPPF